jgi:glycosyltransferase involved in cell wall biosynthesis
MTEPTPITLAVHHAKVQVHRALRWWSDRASPITPAERGAALRDAALIGEDHCALHNGDVPPREWPLERGKLENLRVAARRLDGLELAPGQVLSFWAQVGPPLRVRGFVEGRELREGCVVPGIGGGLCLLSNAIFAAARRAGLEIVERHPHSRRVPGSRAELGEDATVAWNYVDLRVRGRFAWRLEVELDPDWLHVRLRSADAAARPAAPVRVPTRASTRASDLGPSCLSCDRPCVRARPPAEPAPGRRVWLLDAVWPEYAVWLRTHAHADDRLATPIDGELLGRERYAWPHVDVAERLHFPIEVVLRSLRSRALAEQGAARQQALLDASARLAAAMAERLRPDDVELIIAHELLPFLAQRGVLGGRRFTVLMQRWPLAELHATLDRAARAHVDSPTIADFRAPAALVAAEAWALEHAASILTPHAEIAAHFGERATRLAWVQPRACTRRARPQHADARPRVWLPASTVARKGAYELRDALARLDRPLVLHVSGRALERPDFWSSLPRVELAGPPRSLAGIDVAVLPAWVEHAPRALLAALAQGLPVVASRACGLAGVRGVVEVATGEVEPLAHALAQALKLSMTPTQASRAATDPL